MAFHQLKLQLALEFGNNCIIVLELSQCELEFIEIKLAPFFWPTLYFIERLVHHIVSTVIELNVHHTGGPAQH